MNHCVWEQIITAYGARTTQVGCLYDTVKNKQMFWIKNGSYHVEKD